MADQHHETAPAVGNNIANDIPDIAEAIRFHWDCIQAMTGGSSTTSTAKLIPGNHGLYNRSKFTWKDADEIYINGGFYHLAGTTDQMCYWSSQLTFQFGSGGSNANSDDLNVSDWHYLYLDDSAIATAADNLITNAQLINSTEEPTWNNTKKGWYGPGTLTTQVTDRCIGAFLTNASSELIEFFHTGDFVLYADEIDTNISAENIATSFGSDIATLTVPSFCRMALATFKWIYGNASTTLYWRTAGQTATNGHEVARVQSSAVRQHNTLPVICDSNLQIDLKEDTASTATASIYTNGWYFPEGM